MTFTTADPLSFLKHRLASSLDQEDKDPRSVYLKIYIDPQTQALLSMKNIQEAAILPSRLLTTMPNMPSYVLGLTNRRGRVMWVVDMSQMMGLSKVSFIPPKIDILVVKADGFTTALAVHKVEGTMRVLSEDINAVPSHLSLSLIPYLQGCVFKNKEIFLILDVEAIAQSPLLHQA